MKNIYTILALFIGGFAFAQECNEPADADFGEDIQAGQAAISLYSEPFKQKNYQEAKSFWWNAQSKAPKYKPLLYSHGIYIYKDALKDETDEAKKEALTDTIFMIYDLWVENFGDCYEIQLDKGTDLIKYRTTTEYEAAYNLLKNGLDAIDPKKAKTQWLTSSILSAYYMVGNKKAECDALLNQYDKLSEICAVNIELYADDAKKMSYYVGTQEYLDQTVAPCASCDKLEELFQPKVAAAPNDTALIMKAVKMLDSKGCTSSQFYMELATKIHKWSPSATSAISIGNYWYSNKDYKKAADYYEEGLNLSKDNEEKLNLYEKIAQIDLSRGNYKSAVNYARKMDDQCKANGIIARAIAASAPSCGTSTIEVSFAYCLAIDYAEKAKGCVSSSTVDAWKNRLASKSDLFLNEYKVGESVNVKCWGESTVIRAID